MAELNERNGLSFETKQRKIDNILNKTFLDVTTYSAFGWTAGLLAGIFFHKAAPIRNLFAGVGGSFGYVNNRANLKLYV